ncbi:glycosyltransferase family 4 protein [Mucilaginibacter sp. L3T2-6]|uniref:glycosyltransferase family 4 protein n=1 Tax=Mucilaginibacter sp. L3T2-6 TaxID=3062491 RepID=UPI0026757717|nr:glycosyltransferase family 4 protein [Mucilaginibacter sp. L3T2-6]MDO3644411.1 glycosyltransferase family 4 protein [Mucilaginibacter sp. L3T2-6]MDV6216863.1 glycosyltransferase family 4 protein [Mucilaginibacter sp. L3T2-6]
MSKTGQKILIACDSSKSLVDFRGKLIEEMAKQHHVFVFTPRIGLQSERDLLNSLNVNIYETGFTGSNVSIFEDLTYIMKLFTLMRKVKPDVFFPYTFKPVIYGTVLAKLSGIKMITPMLSGLGYTFSQKSLRTLIGTVTRLLLRFSLSNNERLKIILQNQDDYDTLCKHNVLTYKHQVFVVNGSGVDLDHYTPTQPELINISFLMIARLINAKGIAEYYDAAKFIRSHYPFIKFKLIGSYDDNIDSISPELFDQIKSGDPIAYMGQVNDVRSVIKDSSVVVLPSYYGEGIPRCLLESMAMGRAIITSNSVGCRETVEGGPAANGFLVPVKNASALISKMFYYINNRKAILRHGQNGLALAGKKFDVHKVNSQMLKIMQLN